GRRARSVSDRRTGLVARVHRVPRLGRVREDETQLRRPGHGQDVGPLAGGEQRPADAGDLLDTIYDPPVLQAADDDVVAAVLPVEQVRPRVAGGLDDDDPADGLALLVGLVDEQVGEGAEEVAGAE